MSHNESNNELLGVINKLGLLKVAAFRLADHLSGQNDKLECYEFCEGAQTIMKEAVEALCEIDGSLLVARLD